MPLYTLKSKNLDGCNKMSSIFVTWFKREKKIDKQQNNAEVGEVPFSERKDSQKSYFPKAKETTANLIKSEFKFRNKKKSRQKHRKNFRVDESVRKKTYKRSIGDPIH